MRIHNPHHRYILPNTCYIYIYTYHSRRASCCRSSKGLVRSRSSTRPTPHFTFPSLGVAACLHIISGFTSLLTRSLKHYAISPYQFFAQRPYFSCQLLSLHHGRPLQETIRAAPNLARSGPAGAGQHHAFQLARISRASHWRVRRDPAVRCHHRELEGCHGQGETLLERQGRCRWLESRSRRHPTRLPRLRQGSRS